MPRMGIGNRQLSPDATLMSPVEFSPQSANPTSFGHSGAASAEDADIELDAPTIITKPATLDNRIVDFLALMHALYKLLSSPMRFMFWRGCSGNCQVPRGVGAAGTRGGVVDSIDVMRLDQTLGQSRHVGLRIRLSFDENFP